MSRQSLPSDTDRSSIVIAVNTILLLLAVVTVTLRFTARRIKKARLGPDDWLVLFALVLLFGLYIVSIIATHYGLGQHETPLISKDTSTFLKLLYIFQFFFVLAPPTIKLSLLFFYRRLFVGKLFTIINHTLMGVVGVWLLVGMFLAIFDCYPPSNFWTTAEDCVDFRAFAIGYGAANVATSLAIWCLPIPLVLKLQLPTGQKIALLLVFILGLFDVASTIARLVESVPTLSSTDQTWDLVPAYIWSVVEPTVGIMCASLPTTRVILVAIIPQSWRRNFSSSKGQPSYATSNSWPPTNHTQDAGNMQTTTYIGANDLGKLEDSSELRNISSMDGIIMTKDLTLDVEGGSSRKDSEVPSTEVLC